MKTTFNEAQLHLLEMAAHIDTPEALDALKDQLVEFYARRVDEEMDKLWKSGQWNQQTLEDLKTAHYRTPYKQ
ncbi:MAG: dephospho-CoA kinase [Bacteroides intestinalis]|nr:dephospho-CoA kinase [Bacteroides intestinalis]